MSSKKITIAIVGVPSGEYFDITIDQFNALNNSKLLYYKNDFKIMTFDDSDYDKVIKILNKESIIVIEKFLEKIGLKKYQINDDFTVDTWEDVIIKEKMDKLPIKFDYVTGNFIISNCGLITLEGCPQEIEGNFDCSNNKLFDLKGGPTGVGYNYDISNNKMQRLKGCPNTIYGNFIANNNDFENLMDGPQFVHGSYSVRNCFLRSLLGAPDYINGDFDCSYNVLDSLQYGPFVVEDTYDCSFNYIDKADGFPNRCEVFDFSNNEYKIIQHQNKFYNKLII